MNVIETRWFRWICGSCIGACVVVRAIDSLFWHWDAIRLSRAIAFVKGYDLYTPADSGVISGLIYGPVGYFLYAPAAMWSSPVPAVVTGSVISALVTLGPAALVLWDHRNTGEARPWVFAVFTVLVLHFYASRATSGVWNVHTDAGALGFTCLALYFTLRHPVANEFSWSLVAAGLSAALAVWAKQTTAPILVIPCVYLLLRRCRGGAVWVLALAGAFVGLLAVVFSVFYGFHDLRLAVFDVPSRHPRSAAVLLREWSLITDFMEMLYLIGLVVVGSAATRTAPVLGISATGNAPSRARWSSFIPDWNAWPIACATGLALLPMSLLGRMKSGGSANSFGLADYFLAIGIGLLVLRLAARTEFRQGVPRRALEASLVLLLIAMGVRTAAHVSLTSVDVLRRWPPPIQVAYEYVRGHPGTTYFPWHPLAHLLGEGRYFHTGWGVMERDSAGFLVSDAHFREYLPDSVQRVAASSATPLSAAMKSRAWNDDLLKRLPELRCRAIIPELPGWIVLERGPENCRSALHGQPVPASSGN